MLSEQAMPKSIKTTQKFGGSTGMATNSTAADNELDNNLGDNSIHLLDDDDEDDGSRASSGVSPDPSSQADDSSSGGGLSQASSQTSSAGTGSFNSGSTRRREAAGLARTFNEASFKVRLLWFSVMSVMVLTGIFAGQATHSFASRSQVTNFEQEFFYYAEAIARRSSASLREVEVQMSSQTVARSLNAKEKQEYWPFVTSLIFERQGRNMKKLNGAETYLTAVLVQSNQRLAWEQYTVEQQGWVQAGLNERGESDKTAAPIFGYIHTGREENANENDKPIPDSTNGPFAPVWQISPAPVNPSKVNFNLYSRPVFVKALYRVTNHQQPVLTGVLDEDEIFVQYIDRGGGVKVDKTNPRSCLIHPILGTAAMTSLTAGSTYTAFTNSTVAAELNCFTWDSVFRDILPNSASDGIVLVLSNTCDQVHTYEIQQTDVIYVGPGDLHNPDYDYMAVSKSISIGKDNDESIGHLDDDDDHVEKCSYKIEIYPTEELEAGYANNDPFVYTVGVASIFGLSIFGFLLYGSCVERRQKDSLETTLRVHAIVGSLFPKNVLNRLLEEQSQTADGGSGNNSIRGSTKKLPTGLVSAALQVQGDDCTSTDALGAPNIPIADLFPNCTVMYSDLVGFTAWSSAREPTQVFTLLETVYYNFDVIARKRRVFKVETIGDCYVAVCGLPEPRKHHATVMAKFANDCMEKLYEVVRSLEIDLGPDTADLSMRFGMNSGPVTAGVLRGEKSRFQLFGETVDLAALMEHKGMKNRIHVSQATADLIILSGKEKWVKAREDKVKDETRGDLQTYWVTISVDGSVQSRLSSYLSSANSTISGASSGDFSMGDSLHVPLGQIIQIQGLNQMNEKTNRLVDWMTELMSRSLKKIVAMREHEPDPNALSVLNSLELDDGTVLDEVKEIIRLPGEARRYFKDPSTVVLDNKIQLQLKEYVSRIASMYREIPFHGFEHASHVTMSVGKLLSRIVDTNEIDFNEMSYKDEENFKVLHETTYGITSDPLTQFALTFSALIHDVDHTGVPNATLIKEKSSLAELYNNKSVAEQNSVDLAWDMFLEPQYNELRRCICPTNEEYQRFRQLVVNTVMATDIVDKELGALRKERWRHAFDEEVVDENPLDTVNRKATIVIEHLMQASDVAHTMQHWHVYQKWNERFFQECYMAFKEGRAEKDPSIGWYKGEIGFFDFYIIPLAKKLKDCGVFGVSSDEYLNYAQKNRDEWQLKGEYLVAEYITRYEEKYGTEDINEDDFELEEYTMTMK